MLGYARDMQEWKAGEWTRGILRPRRTNCHHNLNPPIPLLGITASLWLDLPEAIHSNIE